MNEIISQALDELHLAEPSRGINRFKKELIDLTLKHRRYSVRLGKLIDDKGIQADLKADLRGIIDASGFIPRKSDVSNSRYVSPFVTPDDETRKKYAREMTGVIDRLLDLDGFVASDQEARGKATSLIARNFLYETDDSGEVVFRKINSNGLLGEQRITFGELSTFFYPLIDRDQSKIAGEYKQAEWVALAKKLLNQDNPKKEILEQKIKELRKHEIAISIPAKKLPELNRAKVEREFLLREAAMRGLDASNLSSNNRSLLQNQAKSAVDELSNVFEIKRAMEEIKPQTSGSWENLTYEL